MNSAQKVVLLGTSYSTQAKALFAAMTTPPTGARKKLINTTISALMGSGAWAKADVLYVTAAETDQAARLNWKAPGTFTLVNGGTAPTFEVDRGFTGNGTDGRLDTTWIPNTHGVVYLQDDASFCVWFTANVASNTADVGNATAPMARMISRSATNTMNGYLNDNTNSAMASSITDGRGLMGFERIVGNKKAYRNGAAVGADVAVASTGRPTQSQWLCGVNSSIFSAKQQAGGAWGASGLQALLYPGLLPYMQAVGASA